MNKTERVRVGKLIKRLDATKARLREFEDFAESMLNPERNGLAVNNYVRDQARRLLGIKPCEFKEVTR